MSHTCGAGAHSVDRHLQPVSPTTALSLEYKYLYAVHLFPLPTAYCITLQDADLVLLIGTNPRFEAPLVNTRIRKR